METNKIKYVKNNYRLTDDGRVYRKGEVKYNNGDFYDGEWVDGKRHGKGIHVYKNGDRYVGDFENGLRHGFGVFSVADRYERKRVIVGQRYEGQWVKGCKEGMGLLILGTGESYEGEFKNDKFHGRGVYMYSNGDRYEGSFASGMRSGQGRLVYKNGSVYEGNFQLNKFNGHGRFTYAFDGGSYLGSYMDGLPHGQGRREFGNGSSYDGDFRNGKMHGEGVWISYTGDAYVGQFKDNKFDGFGVINYSYGDRYEGQFKDGLYFGRGRYVWSDGGSYDGEYLPVAHQQQANALFAKPTGRAHGYGVRVWANGNTYKGHWADGQMQGKGCYAFKEGLYEGTFHRGQRQGRGTMTYGFADGSPYECPLKGQLGRGKMHDGNGFCKYVGAWERDEWEGFGTFTCADNTRYQGEFRKGLRHGAGTQFLVPEADKGDPQWGRFNTGGFGALYRVWVYQGQWRYGAWHGDGLVKYSTGARVAGNFQGFDLGGGKPAGRAVLQYPRGGKFAVICGSNGDVVVLGKENGKAATSA